MPNASLRVLIPEATENYITNPSLYIDTTGWTAFGATISRSLERARFGISSLKIVTNGTALNEGTYFRVSDLAGIQSPVTVSAYVRGAGKIRIRLNEQLGQSWSSVPVSINDNRWTRIEVTGYCTGKNDVRLYVETAESSAKVRTFYVDGAQMELKSYSTTYCDGTQPGCRWNIVAHSTKSTRDPYTRQGGKWVALAGPCRKDDNIYITNVGGMGMPSISNNVQPYAIAPGSYFQNSKVNSRVITVTFNVKKTSLRQTFNPSLDRLHELRQQLIDIFKPDKGTGDEEFMLEYTDGAYPIYISARYEAGLEGSWDIRNQWVNSFPIRFLSCSPLFWEDDQEVSSLQFTKDLGVLNFFAARENGAWNNMNYGSSGSALNGAFAFGKNGEIYATVGNFVNNDARAIQPFVNARRIAKWNGTYFEALEPIGANNSLRAVAVAPNGYVYACGSFTSIGGVAANRVAYWDGSAWHAMGSGLNNDGFCIAVAPNGDVYTGGLFTTAGGISASYIARWDGLAWHSMGAYAGLNGWGRTIVPKNDGRKIYIGGNFARETGGVGAALNYVAEYDPVANTFSPLGVGFGNNCLGLVISPLSNIIYACGDFTTTGATIVNHIAQWNGSQWISVGGGIDYPVYGMDVSPKNENLLAGGPFSLAGGVSVRSLALWNGSVWTPFDIDISHGGANKPEIWTAIFSSSGDVYIAGSLYFNTNSSQAAAINYLTNIGSSEVSPVIYVRGPGRLRWLENQTTKKTIYIDLTILQNEEVTIDFGRAKIFSSIRSDLAYSILPGSDFKNWKLAPGENKIAAFMTDDVGGIMQISYTPQHQSVDATARGNELS